jgi:hypothetical protein
MAIYLVTLDGSAAVRDGAYDLTSNIGDKIILIDSAGKQAIGYIKAADTAEHYE